MAFELSREPLADEAVRQRITERERLRAEGRYEEADAVRAELRKKGILLEDTAEGTRWRRAGG